MLYTDLHCDTAYELHLQNVRFKKNNLHIDLEKIRNIERYSQVYAIWSENEIDDDENYSRFFSVRDYFLENLSESDIKLCKSGSEYNDCINSGKSTAILAVEGGKLLSGELTRLDALYEAGVRFFTLVWKDDCKIGGAYNTINGLTAFGRQVIVRLNELGIISDVSHASEKTFWDTIEISTKPVIATHSNSKTIYNHRRNLTNEQFKAIKKSGGIVGISLCRGHVAEEPAVCDSIRHIEHYISLGGENSVCFGCDFDGASLVGCVDNISDMYKFVDEMKKIGYNDNLINNLMYKNADRFIINNL